MFLRNETAIRYRYVCIYVCMYGHLFSECVLTEKKNDGQGKIHNTTHSLSTRYKMLGNYHKIFIF